jgi:hypothetical protein
MPPKHILKLDKHVKLGEPEIEDFYENTRQTFVYTKVIKKQTKYFNRSLTQFRDFIT